MDKIVLAKDESVCCSQCDSLSTEGDTVFVLNGGYETFFLCPDCKVKSDHDCAKWKRDQQVWAML